MGKGGFIVVSAQSSFSLHCYLFINFVIIVTIIILLLPTPVWVDCPRARWRSQNSIKPGGPARKHVMQKEVTTRKESQGRQALFVAPTGGCTDTADFLSVACSSALQHRD